MVYLTLKSNIVFSSVATRPARKQSSPQPLVVETYSVDGCSAECEKGDNLGFVSFHCALNRCGSSI